MHTAASLILFETRMGFLDESPPSRSKEFLESIKRIQSNFITLMMLPMPLVRKLNLKVWQEHVKDWDVCLEIGKGLLLKIFLSPVSCTHIKPMINLCSYICTMMPINFMHR